MEEGAFSKGLLQSLLWWQFQAFFTRSPSSSAPLLRALATTNAVCEFLLLLLLLLRAAAAPAAAPAAAVPDAAAAVAAAAVPAAWPLALHP